jgi:methionine-rich copper-binding protein CopC
MSRSRWLRALLCSICLVLVSSSPVFAHAELESATPAEGEELVRAPDEVRLSFAEPVEATFSPIEVYDSDGDRVDGDDARSDPDDPSTVVASVQEGLPAGSYTVRWAITSADGDPVSGEYAFSVSESSGAAGATRAAGEEAASSSGDEPLTDTGGFGSVLLYAGLALCAIVVLGLSLRGRGR